MLAFSDVWKSHPQAGGEPVHALRGVSLSVAAGASVAITGRSGSGKSTFLHLAAGIEEPSRGTIVFAGRDLATLGERERTLHRRDHVGLVFQFFHLLPHLSARENVVLPALIAGDRRTEYEPRTLRDQMAAKGWVVEGDGPDAVVMCAPG